MSDLILPPIDSSTKSASFQPQPIQLSAFEVLKEEYETKEKEWLKSNQKLKEDLEFEKYTNDVYKSRSEKLRKDYSDASRGLTEREEEYKKLRTQYHKVVRSASEDRAEYWKQRALESEGRLREKEKASLEEQEEARRMKRDLQRMQNRFDELTIKSGRDEETINQLRTSVHRTKTRVNQIQWERQA